MTDDIVCFPVTVMTGTLIEVQRVLVIGTNPPDFLLEGDKVGLERAEANSVGTGPMVAFHTHWLKLKPDRPRHLRLNPRLGRLR